jgi:hypothetical protein
MEGSEGVREVSEVMEEPSDEGDVGGSDEVRGKTRSSLRDSRDYPDSSPAPYALHSFPTMSRAPREKVM